MSQSERVERSKKAYQLLSDYILRFEEEMSKTQVKELSGLVDLLEEAIKDSN